MKKEIEEIIVGLKQIETLCKNLLHILPNFDITDKKILPYGLKPHTRSVSWLVGKEILCQCQNPQCWKQRKQERHIGS